MLPPSKVRFELLNGISEPDLKSNKYIIYAHKCRDGIYIGVSGDPVKRWQEHWSDAFNPSCQNHSDKFRIAIRTYQNNFKHFIIQVANTEIAAKNKEAAAILYYKATLNIKPESISENTDFGYRPIDNQITKPIILEKKPRIKKQEPRGTTDRISVIAEIYTERSRKRLRSVAGQPFPEGLNIECARDEREKFSNGDLVVVKVALSYKNGVPYLVAEKTAELKPAKINK